MTASDQTTTSIQIILVDDEPLIIDLLKHALTDGGFAVTTAATGEEAIRLLEAVDSKYRALVTDVNFPSSNVAGWDVAKRAREINPDLPVVYITGSGGSDWAANGVPNSVLVAKPFAPAQIVTAVSQLLNLGNTPGA
jgi:CheY-like chemotaxis protein